MGTENGSIQGNLQFSSISRNVSRCLPAHVATLTTYKESDVHPACTILTFAHKPAGAVEVDVNMIEAGPQKDANGVPLSGFTKKQFKIPINPAIAQTEFPMFMRSSDMYSFTYMVTRSGMLYVHDIGSGITVFQAPVSQRGVFAIATGQHAECLFAAADGMICRLDIDKNLIVDYMMSRLGKSEAAFKLAMRANLRGADKLFSAQFENLFSQRNWKEAALLCKKSPADTLRNAATLQRFEAAGDTVQIGEPAPVLIYLATMLENDGQLSNEAESL
jgi:clathrin heavy chain